MYIRTPLTFEWDSTKNAANITKHGVAFDEAAAIFDEPVLALVDGRKDYGETRIQAVGMVDGRVLTVLYTDRGKYRRIISARRANKRERRAYRQAFGD